MPLLIMKALECERPHSLTSDLFVKLVASIDGESSSEVDVGKVTFRERTVLNKHLPFAHHIEIKLEVSGFDIKIGDPLRIITNNLPHMPKLGLLGFHRGQKLFKEAAAHYTLWYEVIPDGMSAIEFHSGKLLSTISLRAVLGRTGRGALTVAEHNTLLNELFREAHYRCSEVISVKDIFTLHRHQDGEKGHTNSLRKWIAQHCNIWGEESVMPLQQLPDAPLPGALPQWRPINDERSYVLAGFVSRSKFADEDNPAVHMSRDWIFNLMPSPAFSYMLAYTAKTKSVAGPANPAVEATIVPLSHNEWESGSIPVDWRPVNGEYVTIWGRHVFDLGHMPVTTEIHPPHTIVRERTLANGKVNRVIIGMGFSGGFPGSVKAELGGELDARWNNEFGGFLEHLSLRNRRCWPTNVKKHPLQIKLFPPIPRPSPSASLQSLDRDWKIITIRNRTINDFLKRCGAGGSEGEKMEHTFAEWFPDGLEIRPVAFAPRLTDRRDYLDLEIDLSLAQDLPVAYWAQIDYGWREP
jgi:hypothetical protein